MKNLIFVLEDDKDIAEIIELILQDSGFRIACSPTVNDFQDRIAASKPDLVLLDINLPDGNGAEVCKDLKSDKRFSGIPVILMSAGVSNQTALNDSLADDFISKPFDIADLEKRIKALVA
ncbi:response regulator transcription factor [Pedobacter jeongneungensis]|uniref:response regulator transcription factor n=1 Tax=Pedobacter jeongneungensis TaxID=947309 RepID=UPI00046960EB|nr:response regulator transcription factor [Pedobacter jeongneungensis]